MEVIKDYFLIGDLHSSALVSKSGSIDWLCLPHFDSPSIFTKILDDGAGEFSVKNSGYTSKAEYVPETAIVETVFSKVSGSGGSFSVKDFMVPSSRQETHTHLLIRKFKGLSGKNKVILNYAPKVDYGKTWPKIVEKKDRSELEFSMGKERIVLHLPKGVELARKARGNYEIVFDLSKGQTKEVVLEYAYGKSAFRAGSNEMRTRRFWKKWISKGKFFSECRDKLVRSAITLKLMQFYPTGALIAAPTTSLPEAIGGNRNWDYRYVWVRDATFTLYAFYVLGYTEEAKKFFEFVEKISKECKECNITADLLYTVSGFKPGKEKILKHLSGYKNSKPVRINNEASGQFQLDVYGALIDSYYFMMKKGFKISRAKKDLILDLVKNIEQKWKEKDSGIWEFRENIQEYTYSKVMAWVGVNRTIRMCDKLRIPKKRKQELIVLEDEIRNWIWKNCYDEKSGKLLQYTKPESKFQDATNFLFVMLQFLDRHNSKTREIIKHSRRELVHADIFTHRYKLKDEFKGAEGSFILCTFWMIAALAITGDVKEAERLFKKFDKEIPKHGLMSEEINHKTKEYLGNYPQAFSHMGYIMSAYYIDKYKRRLNGKKS